MSLVYKRILIFFSIALNIGFIAMAVFHVYDRATPREDRRWEELMTIVGNLDLPREKASAVKDMMADFREKMNGIDGETKAARRETMDFLARSGALDPERFHGLIEASDALSQKKRRLFEAHVLGIRTLLGDEKGAEFFSRLREHILSKKNSHHS